MKSKNNKFSTGERKTVQQFAMKHYSYLEVNKYYNFFRLHQKLQKRFLQLSF